MKVSDRHVFDLQNQCDEKDEQIQELYERCAEQTLEIRYNKDQIRRLQESLQNSRDEIDNLSSRFLVTLNSEFLDLQKTFRILLDFSQDLNTVYYTCTL